MTAISDKKTARQPAILRTAALLLLLMTVIFAAPGCGIQIDEANEYMQEGAAYQAEAEEILARFQAFSSEWEEAFSGDLPAAEQIAAARELVTARTADLEPLGTAIGNWQAELEKIDDLSVDSKIKEYVNLRLSSIRHWKEYVDNSLAPLLTAYGEMVDIVERGNLYEERSLKAEEIKNFVSTAADKIGECHEAAAQADEYFKENELGETRK